MKGDPEKSTDKMHELNRRVLDDPANKLKIIQAFYSERLEHGDKDGADMTLLVRSIVTAREESASVGTIQAQSAEISRSDPPLSEEPNSKAPIGGAAINRTPMWKKTKFWAIVLSSVVSLIVGYWQFYKPSHTDPAHPQLLVFVRNARSLESIPNARVVFQTESGQKDQLADSLGTTHFSIANSDGSSWRIYVTANGYENRNIQLNGSVVGSGVDVFLEPVRSSEGGSNQQKPPSINGTWEVVALADVNNSRIGKGTFDFSPQHDRSIIVIANVRADDMDVRLTGTATLQGDRLSVTFTATNTGGGSWSGQGDFTFVSSKRLSGRIQSKRGDDIPLTLNRVR